MKQTHEFNSELSSMLVNEKMIQQLSNIATEIKIMNLNVTTAKSSKKKSQSLIEFYKLANSKYQIFHQIQNHYFDKSDSILGVDIIHKTMLKYNQEH